MGAASLTHSLVAVACSRARARTHARHGGFFLSRFLRENRCRQYRLHLNLTLSVLVIQAPRRYVHSPTGCCQPMLDLLSKQFHGTQQIIIETFFFKTCLHVSIILLKHKLKASSRSFLRGRNSHINKKIKKNLDALFYIKCFK
jgi:hypothetical protein